MLSLPTFIEWAYFIEILYCSGISPMSLLVMIGTSSGKFCSLFCCLFSSLSVSEATSFIFLWETLLGRFVLGRLTLWIVSNVPPISFESSPLDEKSFLLIFIIVNSSCDQSLGKISNGGRFYNGVSSYLFLSLF